VRISKFELAVTFFILVIFGVFAAEMIWTINGKIYMDLLETWIFRLKGTGPISFLQWACVILFALSSILLFYRHLGKVCKAFKSILDRFYVRDGKILFRWRNKTTI